MQHPPYSPLPHNIIEEIAADDLRTRFDACRAVEATVWSYGLRACHTPAERALWQSKYAAHLRQLLNAWRYIGDEPRVQMSPGVDAARGSFAHKKRAPAT